MAHLERLGFERSPFTATRWVKHQYYETLGTRMVASVDITSTGLKFSAWPDANPQAKKPVVVRWDGMELIPLLVYCQLEGLL